MVVFAQYTGDSRYAMLHLDRVKEECWDSVSLNTSLWTREFAVPAPPIHIVDTLCSNDYVAIPGKNISYIPNSGGGPLAALHCGP